MIEYQLPFWKNITYFAIDLEIFIDLMWIAHFNYYLQRISKPLFFE